MTTHDKKSRTLGNLVLGIALALPAFAGVAIGKDQELPNVPIDPPPGRGGPSRPHVQRPPEADRPHPERAGVALAP